MPVLGILFALAALACWGLGDFLIQRTTRLDGSLEALFCIGAVSTVGIFPFIYHDIASLSVSQAALLILTGCITFCASLCNFEALRAGKIAVIEPIIGLELPLVVVVSILFVGEHPTALSIALIAVIFLGTVLAVVDRLPSKKVHHLLMERGVWLALVAAAGTGLTSVFIGLSSQATSALMAVWVAHTVLTFGTGVAIMAKRGFGKLARDLRRNPWPVAGQSVFDTLAWIAFAFATTLIPISIATGVSGGYVALAVLLGVFVNRERLWKHQIVGIIAVIAGVTALSVIW